MTRRAIFTIFTVVALSTVSKAALADCGAFGCSDVTVTKIMTSTDGTIEISSSGNEAAIGNCSGSSGKITLNPSAQNAERIYSTLLASLLGNEKVFLRTHDTPGLACQLAYIEISG